MVSAVVGHVRSYTAGQRGSGFVFDGVPGSTGNSIYFISGQLISHAAAHVIPHRRGAVIRDFVRPRGLILGPTEEGKPQVPQPITRVDAKTELSFIEITKLALGIVGVHSHRNSGVVNIGITKTNDEVLPL